MSHASYRIAEPGLMSKVDNKQSQKSKTTKQKNI